MTEYESEMLEIVRELNDLKMKVRNADKWLDYARETINDLQDKIFDMQEKYGKA